MESKSSVSRSARWMKAIIAALKELDGQGTIQEVCAIIAQNEKLSQEELRETRGKSCVNKFQNEVAFARIPLVRSGYIDSGVRGVWRLTDDGYNVEMTDELAQEVLRRSYQRANSKKSKKADYSWINFYIEFANRLLDFKDNRSALIEKIVAVFDAVGINIPRLEEDGNIIDIDPFTVFALFNRGNTDSNRIKILNAIADSFNIDIAVPSGFDGVPLVNNQRTAFYPFKGGRGENDIDNLWSLFVSALRYADGPNAENRSAFCRFYDKVITQ